MTRFLYGDSSPFPFDFNFLATIEAFMTSATRVVLLETETKQQAREAADADRCRSEVLTGIKGLHQRLMLALERATNDPAYSNARDYANEVSEAAKRIVDRHHRSARELKEREEAQLAADRERRAAEARQHIQTFFLGAKLPVTSWSISMELSENRYGLHASMQHPQRVASSVEVDGARDWSHPRKVSEFVTEADLNVGVKKSFFKGTVSAELIRVDDWIIGSADLRDEQARIAIRKKVTERDALVFHLRRSEHGMSGNVDHPLDPNAAALPTGLADTDLAKLDVLWRALRHAAAPTLEHRTRLLSVVLDDADVFATNLALPLTVRLVDTFAPIVRSIAERSPNDHELTLKVEYDHGKREEIYLRRDELVSKLQPLSAEGRAVFGPLGLDDWMPTLTIRPPEVGVGE